MELDLSVDDLIKRTGVSLLWICLAGTVSAASLLPCTGDFRGGKKPDPMAMEQILSSHREWSSIEDRRLDDPRRANLCEADLRGINLGGANLTNANLRAAELTDVYFTQGRPISR